MINDKACGKARGNGRQPYERPLGAERRFLRMPNANVVMAARISGPNAPKALISKDLLTSALAKVRQKHPLLGARIRLDADAAGYFTQEGVPEIPVDVMPRSTDDAWIQAVIEELSYVFAPQTGPLIHMVLLQAPQVSDLVINANHSICDTRSLAYLIRDLLTYLGNPDQATAPQPIMPIPIQDNLPPAASGGFLSRLFISLINKKWARKDIAFDEDDYRDLHRSFWDKHSPRICHWMLSAPQVSALVSRCRVENVTVNSALYTAFLAAQHDVHGASYDYVDNILVPVDFRDRLTQPVGEAVGFYASAVQLPFAYTAGEPFWNTARTIHGKVKQQLTDKQIFASQRVNALVPSLLDALVFAKHGKLDDKMTRKLLERTGLDERMTDILVSNAGRLNMPVVYGDLKLEALIPSAVYSDTAESVVEIATVGGAMYLTLTYGAMAPVSNLGERIREAAMKHLREAVGW